MQDVVAVQVAMDDSPAVQLAGGVASACASTEAMSNVVCAA
jgi:hypothetical protein